MSLPRYPGYKDCDIQSAGPVPSHWECIQLKRLGTIRYGIGEPPIYREEGLPLIRATNVHAGKILTSGMVYVDPSDIPSQRIVWLKAGDVIVVRSGAYTGDSATVTEEYEGAIAGFDMVLRLHGCLPAFAQYGLLSPYLKEAQIDLKKMRAAQPHLNAEELGQCLLILPPIEEQIAISSFLDRETAKIDALIAEQERLLTLLAEKRHATVSHAVTRGLDHEAPMKDSGVTWLGEVPAHWEIVGLTKYLESVVDYRGRTPTKVNDGVFLVTAKNIRNGVIDYEASQEYIDTAEYDDVMRRGLPLKGDVLFTTEAPLGQVAIVDREDIALAQRIIKFRAAPDRLESAFLKMWIMGSACQFNLEQLATGSTALGIKGSKVGQVRLCLPPLDEQREIVRHIAAETSKLDTLKAEAERAIELLKERRSALISAAVTGKIDVRNAVPQELAA
ncbi:restriction endonuclease subunit S [Paraburkholderia sp. EG287A]|uniref:restriction endonuclease subunit S n=1 Tax=Paraburkholderia sp. EG287A TaxID=3237012 RepID=UPI0034D262B9